MFVSKCIKVKQLEADNWFYIGYWNFGNKRSINRLFSESAQHYLAVAWAVSKCKMFLTGLQHFKVFTDHSPLIPILNNHCLDEIENLRLQRLRAKLMANNFTAIWCKGATNKAPDTLSRNPVWEPYLADTLAECDENSMPEPSIAEIRVISSVGVVTFKK